MVTQIASRSVRLHLVMMSPLFFAPPPPLLIITLSTLWVGGFLGVNRLWGRCKLLILLRMPFFSNLLLPYYPVIYSLFFRLLVLGLPERQGVGNDVSGLQAD